MKILKITIIALITILTTPMTAQTAEEIINNYLENTGGKDNWNKLEGVEMIGVMKVQGMEIPFKQVMLKDGRQSTTIEIQGQKMIWAAYDGETSWTRNQMTMEAEKSDSETTANMKKSSKDFINPFLNYKEKGYEIELVGKETVDGTETFKIKLTKDPILVNGEEQPSIAHYYFDTENFVTIVSEEEIPQGPMKGKKMKSSISDYQEVDGLFFPFSQSSEFQSMEFKEFNLNPEVSEALFAFPEKEEPKK